MKYIIDENIKKMIEYGYSEDLPSKQLDKLRQELEKLSVNNQLLRMRFLCSYDPSDSDYNNFERFKQNLSRGKLPEDSTSL